MEKLIFPPLITRYSSDAARADPLTGNPRRQFTIKKMHTISPTMVYPSFFPRNDRINENTL